MGLFEVEGLSVFIGVLFKGGGLKNFWKKDYVRFLEFLQWFFVKCTSYITISLIRILYIDYRNGFKFFIIQFITIQNDR